MLATFTIKSDLTYTNFKVADIEITSLNKLSAAIPANIYPTYPRGL